MGKRAVGSTKGSEKVKEKKGGGRSTKGGVAPAVVFSLAPWPPHMTAGLSAPPWPARNQRDGIQAEWTGLHHLFSAAWSNTQNMGQQLAGAVAGVPGIGVEGHHNCPTKEMTRR